MLRSYLNQKAEYKPRTGEDDRGQPIYGDAEIIPCRRQKKTQTVLTSTGQAIQVRHVYYLVDPVAESDMLDGLVVMAVPEWTGIDGSVIGYKAVM